MKTKELSYLKRIFQKRSIRFQSDINRIMRLLSLIKQFNRIKFEHDGSVVPQEYLATIDVMEDLLPPDKRDFNYLDYEQRSPTLDSLGDNIVMLIMRVISKTLCTHTRTAMQSVDTNLFEPPDMSDVSSTEMSESMPQVVSDSDDDPQKKKRKTEANEC